MTKISKKILEEHYRARIESERFRPLTEKELERSDQIFAMAEKIMKEKRKQQGLDW